MPRIYKYRAEVTLKVGVMAVIDQAAANSEQAWDPAPGVDIVMPVPDGIDDAVLDGRTLKLIGALHRRFWGRRRELLSVWRSTRCSR